MRLNGFIGPAYTLDSVNVDCQRCVNLYPELIESGSGKGGQKYYLRATPGLEKIKEVGTGPIRLIHQDSVGRIFVVSGNKIYALAKRENWTLKVIVAQYEVIDDIDQSTDVNTGTDTITSVGHGYPTGLKVRLSSSGSLPGVILPNVDYWIISTGADTFQLAATLSDALTSAEINISSAGSGTLTIIPQLPNGIPRIPFSNIDLGNDSITSRGSGFYTGLKVQFTATGILPTGLTALSDYFLIRENDNSFKIAETIGDAESGTEIDLGSISSDVWALILLGANGIDGGDAFGLDSSSGVVKAASMSFAGDGTDSSTIFVDGSNNYLYKDGLGLDTLGYLASGTIAKATFDVTNDVSVWVSQDSGSYVGATIAIEAQFGPITPGVLLPTYDSGTNTYKFLISGTSLITSADLVEVINNAGTSSSGRLEASTSPASQALFALFTASGGGGDSALTTFGTELTEILAEEAVTGENYGSLPGATDIAWSDGYFILNEPGTNRFWVSDLKDFNVDALSFASSEGSPDLVLAIEIVNRTLYVLNEKSTEVYANTGNADFPFERIQGGFLEIGCFAANSVAKIDGSIFFLGRSEDGQGAVLLIRGLQYQRISTHAIEQAISGYANPQNAVGYTYFSKGHLFYVLNFDEATWAYDLSTGLWHERAFTNESNELERHRVQNHVADVKSGLHIVGDYETNEVYLLKDGALTDDDEAITRLRSSPHISNDLKNVVYSKLQLDAEMGIGNLEDEDPQVSLSWSSDGGHSWSNPQAVSLGQAGQTKKRAIWRRLGLARDRVFQISTTGKGPIRFIDAQIDVTAGAS